MTTTRIKRAALAASLLFALPLLASPPPSPAFFCTGRPAAAKRGEIHPDLKTISGDGPDRSTTLAVAKNAAMQPPYLPSPVIGGIEFDWSTHTRHAPGSDNWQLTWADDGHQYAAWISRGHSAGHR